MKRRDLEHIIRAAATIADDDAVIVLGSQAILGQFPDAPEALLRSDEADVYPRNYPDRADLIDGSIGELSPFHETFGYYAQGVAPSTAVLPAGWEARLVAVSNANTRGATGWCLEVHDLALSKLVAGREKDLSYFAELVAHSMVVSSELETRLLTMPLSDEQRDVVRARVQRAFQPRQSA
jgi:hypothetical protein